MKHRRGKKKQYGGNPAVIPAVLTAVNEVAKAIKPASRLKETRLGKVPVLGSILNTLSQMGYGQHGGSTFGSYSNSYGAFVTPTFNDYSVQMKRQLPINNTQGQKSIPSGSSVGAGRKSRIRH